MIQFVLLLVALSIFIFLWIFVPHILRLMNTQKLQEFCTKHKILVMTFDDGPSKEVTRPILALLKSYDAKASFFSLGQNVRLYPDIVEEIVGSGSEVGNHSFYHLHAWKSLPQNTYHDVKMGMQELKTRGIDTKLYRPPYGKTNLWTFWQIKRNLIQCCYWTIDSHDSWETPKHYLDVLSEIREKNGGVILMHDNCEYPNPNHCEDILLLVENILKLAKEENYTIMTFGELLEAQKCQ